MISGYMHESDLFLDSPGDIGEMDMLSDVPQQNHGSPSKAIPGLTG